MTGKKKNGATTAEPRQRAAISMERRLALLLGALVAFCDISKLKGAPVETARAAASEVTNKVIKPIVDRLVALRTELKGFNMETVEPAKIKDVVNEISRLQARLKTIEGQAKGE